MSILIAARFNGPPNIAHGGYVAGLFLPHVRGAVQVTLRKPTPLDTPLELSEQAGGKLGLVANGELTAEAEAAMLDLDALQVPLPPTVEQARAAEPGSPSHYGEAGVHPNCFGCGKLRADGLRVFVGPCAVHGRTAMAGVWKPGAELGDGQGFVEARFVSAVLDCPGISAFMVDGKRFALLGRFVFEQYAPVPIDAEHVVTAWQLGAEGRKLFAGTALHDAAGKLLAAARATWLAFG